MSKLPKQTAAQHSVHPTGGSLRVFRQFAWLEVDSVKMAFSRPAHQRVTQIVGHLLTRKQRMSEEKLTTRPATREDAERLAKIHVNSWNVAYRNIVPDSFIERFTYENRTRAFSEALENQSEETYVAEVGDQAAGILTIGPNRDDDLDKTCVGELWGIYLDPAFWHKGIGTQLVKEAEEKLASRGYNEIVLWVFRDNWQARKFYEKMGYFPDGKERVYELGQEVVAIRCRKRF